MGELKFQTKSENYIQVYSRKNIIFLVDLHMESQGICRGFQDTIMYAFDLALLVKV